MAVEIHKNFPLASHNTFGIPALAMQLAIVRSKSELLEILKSAPSSPWILGGGSNILLKSDIEGLVIKNEIGGIEILRESDTTCDVRIGSGVVWHDLVLWAVARGLGGIENLALIPGRVGAAPMQNIGAYGVELKDVLTRVEAVDLNSAEVNIYSNEDCQFGYRDSIFKHALKDRVCISAIEVRLTKRDHRLNVSYGAIRKVMEQQGKEITVAAICDTVIQIRQSKLPDPDELGNSGSFFKNPIIPRETFTKIQEMFPNIVHYPAGPDTVKIPAGWLIEKCGWKGKRVGNVGCYKNQALVIVNHGGATGQEIYDFAMQVRSSVFDVFGISLVPEVNIIA